MGVKDTSLLDSLEEAKTEMVMPTSIWHCTQAMFCKHMPLESLLSILILERGITPGVLFLSTTVDSDLS